MELSKPSTPLSVVLGRLPKHTLQQQLFAHSNVSIDPITLAINECMAMASAVRKMNRWNQSGVAALLTAGDIFGSNDDDDLDADGLTSSLGIISSNFSSDRNSSSGHGHGHAHTHHRHNTSAASASGGGASGSGAASHRSVQGNLLLSSFLQLKSILIEAKNIYDIDSLTLLQPFLLVIKSSSTSGYITGLSLNSISKFLSYDIISFKSKNLQNSLIQIISSLTHCRFEAADQNSDDAVLLKVLRLLERLIESPLSILLPNDVVTEVVQTCLSLGCNKKRSEVLRRAAEMSMDSITVEIFSRLKDIEPELEHGDDLQTNFSDTKLPEDRIGGTDIKLSEINTPRDLHSDTEEPEQSKGDGQEQQQEEEKKDEKEQSVSLPQSVETTTEEPFGIVCINEFLGILVSMISPSNQYQHMESTRVFALSLINTAIEVAGLEIPKHPSLLTLVADPISKHVLQIITTTESPALLKASLQLFSTIVIVLGRQLKPQFELSATLIFQSILPQQSKNDTNKINGGSHMSLRNALSKEVLIESLSLLWTRSPVFFTRLFIDYDCDFEKSDLANSFLQFLCRLSLPESALITTDNVPPLCLEGMLSFISGVNERSKSCKSTVDVTHELIEKRKKKTAFIKCAELLNEKPKNGIKELAKEGFIKDENDSQEVAKFFFSKSGRLNKKVLGEFLAKPSNSELFGHFIDLFEFTDLRVDEALRVLLRTFRLPGESQQIERVVERFAERYVQCQEYSTGSAPPSPTKHQQKPVLDQSKQEGEAEEELEPVKPDKDSVFVLSYSIIMLNTDLHNPQVKKQMLLDDYKRNLRGVYNGKDFPEWYLAKIYLSIKDREIIMPEEHHGTDKWFDDSWNNMVSTQNYKLVDQAEFTKDEICQFDKVLFSMISDSLIETILKVFKEASDDHIITRLMSSIDKIASICLKYELTEPIDKLTNALCELSTLTNHEVPKKILEENANNSNSNIRPEIPITQIKIEKKEEEIYVSELAVFFGRDFKAQLSTVVLFRLIKKSNCKITGSWDKIVQIILRLFENCLINPNLFSDFQNKVKLGPISKVKPLYIIKKIKPLNNSGLLSNFASFLRGYSDDPPEPSDAEIESTLSTMDCVKSLNIPNIFAVVSKGPIEDLKKFVTLLLEALPTLDDKSKRYYETETLFILEISVCFGLLLHEDEKLMKQVFDSLNEVKDISKKGQLRVLAYKLLLLRYYANEEYLIATLKSLENFDKELISKQGNQILQPLLSLIDDDSWCCKKLLVEEEYWKSLRIFAGFQIYAVEILRFLETLIKSNDIIPENYVLILGLLDEVSSLGAIGSQFEQEHDNLGGDSKKAIENEYFRDLVDLSKRSISLTSELNFIVRQDNFKNKGMSYSLIQALAHQCFNPCREVREFAVLKLQNIALAIETSKTTDAEDQEELTSFGIFEFGLFPLLIELTKPEVFKTDKIGFIKTQFEIFQLVSKIFLKKIDDLKFEEVEKIWFGLLENFKNLKIYSNDGYNENCIELIKNMILVLQNIKFLDQTENAQIYKASCDKMDEIYPQLKKEFMESGQPEAKQEEAEEVKQEEGK
ncbi:ARF guanine-nucleotide exchange factor 2 [Candida viswanathii]|uniref:ARF guanine-nucleotide exchange factor 2 n=1 Tax=Candida viswanathii TaxID=5486 RepID=A0A367YPF6_9ASCO|nr:ARF guanine-nucleotide exchange factor 2 [Candida viswanathii]